MKQQTLIFVYGRSVVLTCVGMSLALVPDFHITYLGPSLPDIAALEQMAPDVILFDIESPCPTAVFSLLDTRPRLLLLGISPDSNLVRLWSEQRYRELRLNDLAALIEARVHSGEPPREPSSASGARRSRMK